MQQYTFLGIKLTPTGNFTIAQKSLCEKASRAIFKIQKYTNISKLPKRLAFKIFDSTVLPILTYGGEVWGTSVLNNNFKKWDQSFFEKTHLKFCKIYLELNRRASNSATRAELARLPLQITLAKKALKYYSYLCNKDENTIVKQSFIMSKELALEQRKSYIFELKLFRRETACDNADTTDPRERVLYHY